MLKQREGDQPLPTVNGEQDIQSRVIADIQARREVGISRYGTALQPFNGRDGLRDAQEEALDLLMYLKQVQVERDGLLAVARAARCLLNEALDIDSDVDEFSSETQLREALEAVRM